VALKTKATAIAVQSTHGTKKTAKAIKVAKQIRQIERKTAKI
jgi:hypothetical protein